MSSVFGGSVAVLSWLNNRPVSDILVLSALAFAAALIILNQILNLKGHFRLGNSKVTNTDVPERDLPRASASDLASTFIRGKRVSIVELTTPMDVVVRGKTFEDCDLFGPAVIGLTGSGFMSRCSFHAPDVEEMLIELRPHVRRIFGIIGFENCTFRGCRFFLIAMAGTRQDLDYFRDQLAVGMRERQAGQS